MTKLQLELSCVKVQDTIRGMDAESEPTDLMQKTALEHLDSCQNCAKMGATNILDREVTCQEALQVFLDMMNGVVQPKTLKSRLASEHIFGRAGNFGCWEEPCQVFKNVGLGTNTTGTTGILNLEVQTIKALEELISYFNRRFQRQQRQQIEARFIHDGKR